MEKLKFFVLAFLAVMCISCNHKHKPVVVNADTTKIVPIEVTPADAALLNDFKSSLVVDTFNCVEIKFNLDFSSSSQSHSGSGTLRMVNDSLIWMSVSALGLEVGRALFTPDSVKFIFKLKNKYFAGDYSYLRTFLPVDVDFNILQSIFLDKFFIFPKNDESHLSYFSIQNNDNVYALSTLGHVEYASRFGINNTVIYDSIKKKMTENSATFASNNKGVKISYSSFKDFSYHNLPSVVSLNGIGTDFSMVFNYQKVTFGKKMSFNFTIPSNYKPFEF